MVEKAYFVSDLHLGSDQEPSSFLFCDFLKCIAEEKPRYLFLLGDIFDMWLADHEVYVQRYNNVVKALGAVRDAGVEVHYFEGNHDLFLDYYFSKKMGFQIHKGPIEINLFGRPVRIEHGDQMDPEDKGYIFLRWFLRTPVLNWLAPRVPSAIVRDIGDRGSETSRKYSRGGSERDNAIREKIRAHALRVASRVDAAFELLISGHMHVEDDYSFDVAGRNVRSVNLGTWLRAPVAFELTANSATFIPLKAEK